MKALKARCCGISAGVLSADVGNLDQAVKDLIGWGGTIAHVDVMDGAFVRPLSVGPAVVAALGNGCVRDVHLMVETPEDHVAAFARAGADIITVHAEATGAAGALDRIRQEAERLERPILAGLAVMPGTPLELVAPLLDPAPDLILSVAIDPRGDAPADLPLACKRLQTLAQMVSPARPVLAIDGGVTGETIQIPAAITPDIIVSGSAIFRAPDPGAAFRNLEAAWKAPRTP
ncbi:ribulose phosphate epimerase [Tropicimonas sp. TH_r6]|uniref:ribulose-phosphate 3-epimerase n=1 Tax=Tropicimonas sp. TH_r6 TaxID=3082085 RepID=UPI002953BF4A|nr:ribulose phosphate epimerase [Tropicimonas sp. TH_r6]MDV7143991.1 ribulose phosphate epimerase [Tropicimonas sp. TH_r6]